MASSILSERTAIFFIAGGADLIQQVVAEGVMDELQVHLVPILLGRGRRLFNELSAAAHLEHQRSLTHPRGTSTELSFVTDDE